MKKPNFYVKFAVYQVVILIVLIGAVIHTSQICAQPSPLPDWSEAAPAVWKQREIVPMLSVGLFIEHFSIALIAFGFCWEKESRWLWANQQKLITSIRLKRVKELKQPGLEVFFLPKKKKEGRHVPGGLQRLPFCAQPPHAIARSAVSGGHESG